MDWFAEVQNFNISRTMMTMMMMMMMMLGIYYLKAKDF